MNFSERFKYFPVSFYAVTMGLLGLVIALQKAVEIFYIQWVFPFAVLVGTFLVFCFISFALVIKFVFYKEELIKDFLHPIKISFFPTFSVTLLLFSISFLPICLTLACIFWSIGTIVHLFFTFLVMGHWVKQSHYKIEHMNPAWFIPVVGNLLVPIAGASFVHEEFLWFFFSVGLIFWLILMTVAIYRIFFHVPLVSKLTPTLFILIAPPAVGVISYFKLTHGVDNFSRVLYYFALFLALLLISNIRMFLSKKFYLSQWAFTFPIAAISIASFLMYNQIKISFFKGVYLGSLLLVASIIIVLICRTTSAIYHHEICDEE